MPTRFTFRQLEYFISVADHGSIAAAAAKVNVSSPSISSAIVQLEEEFKLELFTRKHAHALTLTRSGKIFLEQARKVAQEARRLSDLSGIISNKAYGPINVGCFLTFAQIVLPELRRKFEDENPEVEFHQFEAPHGKLVEGIQNASLDIALTYDLNIPFDLEFIHLADLTPYALFAVNHPLARKDAVAIKDLLDYPYVLLDIPISSSYFLSLFSQTKKKPSVAERTSDIAVMQSLVANGFGFSMANIRPTTDKSPDGKRLAYVPIKGPVRPMKLGVLLSNGSKSSFTVRRFVEHCRAQICGGLVPGFKMPGQG